MSESHACPDREAFIADMKTMFDELDPETIRKYTSDVLRDMIEMVRQHQVGGRRGHASMDPACVPVAVVYAWEQQAVMLLRTCCMACQACTASRVRAQGSSSLPASTLSWPAGPRVCCVTRLPPVCVRR